VTARCCAGKRSKGFAGWKLLCVLGRPQGRLFFAALPAWRHRSRAPISAGRRLASIAYTRLASRLGQVLPWIKAVWTDTQNQREIPVSQPDIGLPLQCLPLESAGALFERVDKALYTANGCGRDCTIVDEGVARVAQVVLATWQARPASFAGPLLHYSRDLQLLLP
jgi:hypothetical protein